MRLPVHYRPFNHTLKESAVVNSFGGLACRNVRHVGRKFVFVAVPKLAAFRAWDVSLELAGKDDSAFNAPAKQPQPAVGDLPRLLRWRRIPWLTRAARGVSGARRK